MLLNKLMIYSLQRFLNHAALNIKSFILTVESRNQYLLNKSVLFVEEKSARVNKRSCMQKRASCFQFVKDNFLTRRRL